MAYLDNLANGLQAAAGVLNPDIQKQNAEQAQRDQLLRQQQAQLLVTTLAKQVADGVITPEAAKTAAASRGLNVPPELFGAKSLATQAAEQKLAATKAAADRETAYRQALANAAGNPEALRAVALKYASPGDLLKNTNQGGFTIGRRRYDINGKLIVEAPIDVKSPAVGTTRTVQQGDKVITQEYQSDGTWKQIGEGPKFARSVAPVVVTGGDKQLASDELVQGIIDGRIPLPSGFALRSPYWQNVLERVTQKDPTFDASRYQARAAARRTFASGPEAKNVTALNTAIGHLGTLDEMAQALGNGNVRLLNSVTNRMRTELGDPRVQNFETAKQAVSEEVMRVFRQVGASEVEAKLWGQRINASGSPAQLRGVVSTLGNLLESRVNAIGQQYERTVNTSGNPARIDPANKKKLDQLSGKSGQSILDQADAILGNK